MTEWYDILQEIRALQAKVDKTPIEQTTVQSTLYAMLGILGRMAMRMELQRDPPHRAVLDDLRISTLTTRVAGHEAEQQYGFRALERRLDKGFEAINNKLDTIECRLPEPSRSFDG